MGILIVFFIIEIQSIKLYLKHQEGIEGLILVM